MGKRTKVTRSMINREITRIRNIVRQAEKQGYIFNNVIPKNVNVTKSTLNRLRSITREELIKTARRVDLATGEIINTQAEKNIEAKRKEKEKRKRLRDKKQQLKKKRKQRNTPITQPFTHVDVQSYYPNVYLPEFTDIAINRFKAKFSRMPDEISAHINGLLDQLITQQGVDDVALALQKLEPKMLNSLVAQGFTTDHIVEQIGLALIQNLPNASDQYKKDIAEAYESYETGYIIPEN